MNFIRIAEGVIILVFTGVTIWAMSVLMSEINDVKSELVGVKSEMREVRDDFSSFKTEITGRIATLEGLMIVRSMILSDIITGNLQLDGRQIAKTDTNLVPNTNFTESDSQTLDKILNTLEELNLRVTELELQQ